MADGSIKYTVVPEKQYGYKEEDVFKIMKKERIDILHMHVFQQ
ncbi:hypothetical protein Thermo_01318 [Thermoplasmatales archaeon]|nr:hypothetical protein Thermo_01318 [Thermoplasmatales archaeon]